MKTGVQLFGLLNGRSIDEVPGILARIAALGYARVEPCVSAAAIPGYEAVIWPLERYGEYAAMLAEAGLEAISCHAFSEDITRDADAFAALARDYGLRQFVVKSPGDLTPQRLQEAAMNCMRAADRLDGAGASLLLHNEEADIRTRVDGRTAYETLLDLCQGKVGAQVDVGWVLAGGEDPEALLWRNAGRVRSIHFKDFTFEGGERREAVPGQGAVDIPACFQFARAHGCAQVLDMDTFPGGWEADLAAAREALASLIQFRADTVSYLNTLDVQTGAVRTLARFDGVIEAPNWLKGKNAIVYNADGLLYSYDLDTGAVSKLDTGFCDNCNNDHVLSPDETAIAVSHMTTEGGFNSRVYVVPLDGGAPRLVTPNSPSFLHGWSPDGREFAYCAFRRQPEGLAVDVYTVEEGGEEKRLTGEGFNDGPEYAPDGRTIWFNSTRTGLMQLWRMNRDGSDQRQMTFIRRNNWFAHVSPDGQRVAWLSYGPDDLEPTEHLPNMRVELWLMNADGTGQRRIASLFGGQGSINVNSWAPDSRRLAFVSYALRHR